MKGISYLKKILEDNVQCDVESRIVVSMKIALNQNNEETAVMWYNPMNEIHITTKDEFLENVKLSNHYYRISEENIILEINGVDKINEITDLIIECYLNDENYDVMICNLINKLENNRKLELKNE